MDDQITVSQEGFETLDDYKPKEQLTLFNIQELVVKHDLSLSELKDKLKTARGMYNDSLEASEKYLEVTKEVKSVQEKKKEVKKSLDEMPSIAVQLQTMGEMKSEIKEREMAISDYATAVIRMSGKTQFEVNGEAYDVITVAKLVKRKQ